MKLRTFLHLSLVALLWACGDDSAVAGTDEHGNAVAARVLVRDSSGAPAAGVEVVVRPAEWLDGDPLDSAVFAGSRCVTAYDGSCPFAPDERSGILVVRAGDGEFAAAAAVSEKTESDIVLRLAPTGSVQGTLPDAKAGVPVRVPGLAGIAWTDDSGRFSLGSLPEGFLRVRIGASARTGLDSVPVRPRKATVPGRSSTIMDSIEVVRSWEEFDLPSAPVFDPPAGTYSAVQEVSFLQLASSDAVETSLDGVRWEVLNGKVRVMSSLCLKARAIRDGRIVSNVSEACYIVAP